MRGALRALASALFFLLLPLLGAAAASAAPPAPAPMVSVEQLFGNRLLFDAQGAPLIPVRLMEGQTRVEVQGRAGLIVQTPRGPVRVAPNVPYVVVRRGGTAAKIETFTVLETLEGAARRTRRARVKAWASKRAGARALNAGGVYGVSGTVFDNRAVFIVAPGVLPVAEQKALGVTGVTVQKMKSPPRVTLGLPGGQRTDTLLGVRSADPAFPVLVKGVEHSVGYPQHGYADRSFSGTVYLAPDQKGRIAVVNVVPESTLVSGILPSEIFPTAPIAALKAQAVTARGEVFAKVGKRHLADPYLVCSEQHCQVYKGKGAEHPRTQQAAEQTAGELLFKDGGLVDSVYSACCGGHTEPNEVVWDQPQKSALVGRVDAPHVSHRTDPALSPAGAGSVFMQSVEHGVVRTPTVPLDLSTEPAVRTFLALPRELTFCGASTFNQKGDAYRWTRAYDVVDLNAQLAHLGVGAIRGLRIDERGPGGRLRALIIEGTQGQKVVRRELPVRRLFKPALRSGLFVVDHQRDQSGALTGVRIVGGGFGHGSGMCQQGAIGMAEAGLSYREILSHYYAGATVKRIF